MIATITVKQVADAKCCVDIMSISKNGELLVGSSWNTKSENFLHIYDTEGRHISTVKNLHGHNNYVHDATWTPRGNIVFTIRKQPAQVMTVTRTGDVVATTKMNDALQLSVSADDVIYVACGTRGVYQSTDDGERWSRVFTCSENLANKAIKVSSDSNTDIFYVLGKYKAEWHLREYTLNRRKSNNNVTWRDVTLIYSSISHELFFSMAFDGRMKVFVPKLKVDKALRVFTVSQQTEGEGRLDLSEYLSKDINQVAVDSHRNELYVSAKRAWNSESV